MAGRIDSASKSWIKGFKCDGSETTRLASDINRASLDLSLYVTRMKENLNSFVSTLENIEVSARKERQTLAGWILGWLKSLFKALARIFVSLGTFISPFLRSVAPGTCGIAPAESTLGKGAVAFCGAGSELQDGNEPESLESVLLFLKEIVPGEAQNAQKRLERFDEALISWD
ncbi:hypothetical protein BJV77DRAFT_1065925 [Russula vinacea]|nr:hypothetical protein BJV77DRAFT_1065925 [Russula vinacea]